MVTNFLDSSEIKITSIQHTLLNKKQVSVDVLRLDLLHPHISGNKWFKLKYNIIEAQKKGYKMLLSIGGNYSNHLHALAYYGFMSHIKTIGLVRGEASSTNTLEDCKKWGMELHFLPRQIFDTLYQSNDYSYWQTLFPEAYIIPMGGDNELGLRGCQEILSPKLAKQYDTIVCSVGTATTLIGISQSIDNNLIGFMSTQDKNAVLKKIKANTSHQHIRLLDDYKFGGFGKKDNELNDFIQYFQQEHAIELDCVYTAKSMFGLLDLIENNYFPIQHKILFIHTGGLQGNR
ncbi:MAG: pyridoxal-phosphate dependent enzyme [Chitinophagaceae bacterium]